MIKVEIEKRIAAILWTWCGYSVRYADGTTQSLSGSELLAEIGQAEYARLKEVAPRWPEGHYHEVQS